MGVWMGWMGMGELEGGSACMNGSLFFGCM